MAPPAADKATEPATEDAAAVAQSTADRIAASVEAALLSVDRPIPASRLAEALSLVGGETDAESASARAAADAIEAAVAQLNKTYVDTARSFRIESVSGGYRVMTLPEHAEVLAALHRKQVKAGLSKPALETLAIIAYRQPLTRAELEAIRGVSCGEVLKTLIDRGLVTITGRAEELGRPMLYGTTKGFLAAFGLASLKDLPPPNASEVQG